MSTVILKVDLDCVRCYQKISKTLCKLKEREDIQTITFDAKNNTVTISGQFNPQCLCKKLCCKAYNVIKDIQIKDNKEKEKEKEKEKPKDSKPAEPVQVKPKDTVPAESKQATKPAEPTPPAEPKKDKPNTDVKPTEPKKDEPKGNNPAAEPSKDEKKEEQQKNKPKEAPAEANPTGTEKDKAKSLVMNSVEPGLFWIEPVYVNQEHDSRYQPVWADPGYGGNCGWVPSHGQRAVVYGTPAYGGYKNNCQYFPEENTESCIVM